MLDDGHAFPPTMPRSLRDQLLEQLKTHGSAYYNIQPNGTCSQVPIVKDEPA